MRPRFWKSGALLAFAAYAYSLSTMPAHAYLDPGTGSMILQMMLGGVAGAALVGKLYWHRLLCAVGIRKDVEPEPHEQGATRSEARADR